MTLDEYANTLLSSVELLTSIGTPEPRLPELRTRVRKLVEVVGRGVSDIDKVRAELDEVSAEVAAVDARMPTTWFRQRVRFEDVSRPSLMAYASMLAKNASDDDLLDRVELIVTRLVSVEAEDGFVAPLSEEETLPVLEAVASGKEIAPARREAAVSFFAKAAERLDALTSLDELFESGLYLDVKGYKRALEEDRVDPGVLYASVLLNVAIRNHLHRPGATSAQRAPLERRIAKENKRVEEIYRSLELDDVSQRFEEARQSFRPSRARKAGFAAGYAEHRPKVLGVVVIALLLAAMTVTAPKTDFVEERRGRGTAFSKHLPGVLQGGVMHRGSRGRVFTGQVDPAAWRSLDDEERRAHAESLLQALEGEGLVAALLYADVHLVVQVDRGGVRFVGAGQTEEVKR